MKRELVWSRRMAEGQAVVYWAELLRPLIGEPLIAAAAPKRWAEQANSILGRQLTSVETRGKHLLLHVSGGTTIHCHAMMYGSWQFGSPGMRLQKELRQVRLRLRTASHEAAFFNGPVVEFLDPEEFASHAKLNALGPDIMHRDFDRDEVWRRLQKEPEREIGEALLDQRVIAGIGNIYKAEGLFLAGIDPRRPVQTLHRRDVEQLWDLLAPLMWQGVKTGGRVITVPPDLRNVDERCWVYRRSGRLCFQCGEKIHMVRQGELRRATYFCPQCQR